MKRLCIAILFVTVLVQGVLFAGGSGDSGSGKNSGGTIPVEFYQQKPEEGPQTGYKAVIERFHREYPNYRIEMNTVPDAVKVLNARVVAGDIPVLFSDFPTQLQFKEKIKNGYVVDVSDQPFMERITEGAKQLCYGPDGRSYALPFSQNFMGVYYNIDIFKKYNVSIPKTYNEFIAACETFKNNGVLPIFFSFQDVGRVGHFLQIFNIAWADKGIERMVNVINSKDKIVNQPAFRTMAERFLRVVKSYGNTDAFAVDYNTMMSSFANGASAMCIAGSFSRGTILMANPNINMGVFPLPNDAEASTTQLAGVDISLCISSKATTEQKQAALAFMEFITRTENAQIFCDYDGAPSAVKAVVFKDQGMAPVISKIQQGPLCDWMAAYIPSTIYNEMYAVAQQFIQDGNIDGFLKNLDTVIEQGRDQAGL
jgi:raffinose/stachyose/melibiose transport system substrate-binding protein